MADGQDQEKTEPATSKKRDDARKKGQVAQSREIPSVMILLSSLSVFYFAGGWMLSQLNDIMRSIFQLIGHWNVGIESAHVLLWYLIEKVFLLLAPLVGAVAMAGIIGNVSQFGFMINSEAVMPKFEKLNPLTGIKRLFSMRSLMELLKSLFKVLIIGSISYSMIRGEFEKIPGMVEWSTPMILTFIGEVALKMGYYTCLVLIVLAAMDYLFQRWQYERDLRMTKQEIKDEFKQREGDPLIRSRIRAAQREIAMKRMMAAVPQATVIITNPTHLAIAIKFERNMPAPIVVAKGAGLIAERIKEIASQNDIPVIEQKPLARTLFKDVDIGQYVPVDLYHAVAEVLAYVYRLKGLVHA